MIPFLRVRNLTKTYSKSSNFFTIGHEYIHAVDHINFELMSGETLGLVGESGCGKSTLARLICRLEEPTFGEITLKGMPLDRIQGEALRKIRHLFQPIFQDPYNSINPRFTVHATLAEPLTLRNKNADFNSILSLLTQVGLGEDVLYRYPHQLSGGQCQRLGIARALAIQPELIIADEPLSSLDVSIQAQILNLFSELRSQLNLSMILISHDLRAVGHLSDKIIIMYLGRIMEMAPTAELFSQPRHPYTQALFAALPKLRSGRGRKRSLIDHDAFNASPADSGCRFYERCPYHQPACQQYPNTSIPINEKHSIACWRWQEINDF